MRPLPTARVCRFQLIMGGLRPVPRHPSPATAIAKNRPTPPRRPNGLIIGHSDEGYTKITGRGRTETYSASAPWVGSLPDGCVHRRRKDFRATRLGVLSSAAPCDYDDGCRVVSIVVHRSSFVVDATRSASAPWVGSLPDGCVRRRRKDFRATRLGVLSRADLCEVDRGSDVWSLVRGSR